MDNFISSGNISKKSNPVDKFLKTDEKELFLKELNTFKNFLPNSVNTIMDIGCGLGIINII